MTRIGYARVSTDDQRLDLQRDALTQAGCSRIFADKGQSGALARRPQLDAALDYLRPGDTLVVWRLDRLGRSLKDLIATVNDLADRGVGFASITESIDTSTAAGELVFNIFGSLAQFERRLISERTIAGLQAARARGRNGGRPHALNADQVVIARQMYDSRRYTVQAIADVLVQQADDLSRAHARIGAVLGFGGRALPRPQAAQ
jgi:DNA invertase Pin-like site-specific DNA recombinase